MKRPRIGQVGIFYQSLESTGHDSQLIHLPDGGICFVRVEVVTASLSEGLDRAKPRPGENVMNSHPLEAGRW